MEKYIAPDFEIVELSNSDILLLSSVKEEKGELLTIEWKSFFS